jgi:hypothetical protein
MILGIASLVKVTVGIAGSATVVVVGVGWRDCWFVVGNSRDSRFRGDASLTPCACARSHRDKPSGRMRTQGFVADSDLGDSEVCNRKRWRGTKFRSGGWAMISVG